jgi:hypothetical protein
MTKEPRIDDRDRPLDATQRAALELRGDGAPLDRRRRARSRTAIPKIIGYRDLATLLIAIERDHHRRHTAHLPTKQAAIVVGA